jgi:Spy/CpxP family protein refolding chaperone
MMGVVMSNVVRVSPRSVTGALAVALALALALLVGPAALAQGPPPPPPELPDEGSEEWQELMDKIAMLRNFRLIEALDLDEQSGAKLAVYMKDREQQRLELMVAKREVGQEIQRFAEDDAVDDKKAKELLDRAMDVDRREGEFEHDLVEGLDRILTPTQQLKFVLVSREFDREVQEMIRDQRREHHRRPGGGTGAPPRSLLQPDDR